MPDSRISPNTRTHVSYIPAQLSEGKEWYVYFWAWDPATQALKRKRIKINRIKSITERRAFGRKMVENINRDLRKGWSPWIEQLAPKGMHKLHDGVQTFLKRKLLELEDNSKRSYRSMVGMFCDWLEKSGKSEMMAVAFTKKEANEYLDFLLETKQVSARTYNNYLVWCRTLFNWLIEREYLQINPFTAQHKLRTKQKTREVIPHNVRKKVKDHLEINNRGFLLSCYLLFYTEIRPGEQCGLKLQDIDLERQVIKVHGNIAKNKKSRFPTIPNVLVQFMKTFDWSKYMPDSYLFSDDYVPGTKQIGPRQISRTWSNLRNELGIPMKYQFYSLRDSGIIHMLQNKISPEEAMNQAGHSDLEMTTEYARHAVYGPVESIKNIQTGF